MTSLFGTGAERWTNSDEVQFQAMRIRRTMSRQTAAVPRLGNGAARRSDPVSSHEAGVTISSKEEGLYEAILTWLGTQKSVGGTTLEIAEGSGLDRVTVSPRMKPMEKLGLVERAAEKRAGPSGVKSIVWTVSEKNLLAV